MNRQVLALLLAAISALGSRQSFSQVSRTTPQAKSKPVTMLSYIDRTLLIEYQLIGRQNVPLVIAVDPGRMAEVVRAIEASGGKVSSREDDIGYIYVLAPYKAVERLTQVSGIDAIQVDCNPVRSEAAEDAVEKPKKTATPPDPFLQLDNPFTGEASTQASTLKTRHPTFDGRGATAGVVEPADPMLPSMKGALDSKGTPLPKFATYSLGTPVDAVGADAVAEGSYWQQTKAVTPDAQGRISFGGREYIIPKNISAKEWRICVRRPAEFQKKKQTAAVLWAVNSDRVWMLRGEELDFSKAPTAEVKQPFFPLITHAYNPKDKYDSRLWVFNVDKADRLLAFAGTYPSHPSMVASVIAGNGFLGSQAGGIAPAARLAVFSGAGHETMPSRNTAESTFAAFHDLSVDVVESSAAVGDSAREDSSRVYELFADRLIRLTNKPFVKAVGNFGPSLGLVDEFNSSGDVFSIGGFVPQETWRANEGFEPSSDITLAEYSGWGPAEDGGLKPDFLALTQTLSESSYSHSAYEEPYGLYTVSGGTSAAAPNAAGHLALLISAAKQSGVKYDAARLRAAIATTAKFLPNIPARVQGHGLIQVADAWEALRRASDWDPPVIVSTARVVGPQETLSHRTGRGLLEMSGWTPGGSGDRELTVTRVSGPLVPVTYRLRWKESDAVAAFSSSLSQVILRLNQSVKIPVHIHVGEAGSYSAVLDLIDSRVNLVAHSMLSTVFVGQPLAAESGFSAKLTRTLERPGNSVVWVHVPEGLSALYLHVKRADGNDGGRLNVQDPTKRFLPYSLYGSSQGDTSGGTFVKGEAFETFTNPVPGLWQFYLQESSNFSGLKPPGERLKSTEVIWEVTGTRIFSKEEPSAELGTERSVAFTNAGSASVQARITAMGIGSARDEEVLLQPGLQAQTFQVQVPAGATRLEVTSDQESPDATVGLYVYKAPEGPGKKFGDTKTGGDATALLYYDPSGLRSKHWILESPKPGTYVIALDPLKVAASGVKIRYRDVLYHPVFGTVNCDDSKGALGPSASKSATVHWRIAAKPADGRKSVVEVGFIDEDRGYSKVADTVGTPDQEKKLEIVPVPLATQILQIDKVDISAKGENREK
jgi:hypothetical protein